MHNNNSSSVLDRQHPLMPVVVVVKASTVPVPVPVLV
jgi:hypothetical protein